MRIHRIALAALCGLIPLAVGPAHGTIIVEETFTHPDGALVGQTPEVGLAWAAHSGAGTNPFQVTSGTTAVNGNGEDVNAGFSTGAIGTGDVIYAGFDLTIPAIGGTPGNAYFAHFKDSGNFFGSRVWVTAPTSSGYGLAISGDSSITDSDGEAAWGSDLAFDTPYRVVVSYDFDSGAAGMWISPTSQASTSVVSTDGFAGDEFETFALRQSGANTSQVIDNLVVATTFNEAAGVIPEPATVALAFVSLGAMLIRRK